MDLQNLKITTRYSNPDHRSSASPPKFKEDKIVPVHAMKVCRESIGICLTSSVDGSEW